LSFIANASGGASPYTYLWSDGTTGIELNLIADTSTTYTLLVTDYCGTMADASALYIDVEHPVASSSFDYTSEIFVIQLNNNSQPDELQYYWDFGDLTSSDSFEPRHEFLDSEDHVIILSISTSRGCVDETELLYKAPAMIYIPNAFTPDGDGLNDYISIQGANIKTVRMQIFDRWGKRVYELNSPEDKWYGTRKDGDTEYTSSVFNYVVEWTDYRGETFRKTGSILLVN
jgi:gliding motility-associated-like protein